MVVAQAGDVRRVAERRVCRYRVWWAWSVVKSSGGFALCTAETCALALGRQGPASGPSFALPMLDFLVLPRPPPSPLPILIPSNDFSLRNSTSTTSVIIYASRVSKNHDISLTKPHPHLSNTFRPSLSFSVPPSPNPVHLRRAL
jgi:hypothetical protein